MSITVDHALDGKVAVVTLTGQHDLGTVEAVRRVLLDVWGAAPLVVLDLRGCSFVDSTILGAFAGAAKRISGTGGRLVAVTVDGIVAKALHVTGLDALLHPDVELDESVARALELLA